MILHALCQYYQRRQKEADSALPAFGFEQKAIPFVIVIASDGRFLQFEDTRYLDEAQGKKPQARLFTVAKSIKKNLRYRCQPVVGPGGLCAGHR
ncbi:hypothetical protein OS42_41160 [Dickeya oryzae]